MNEKTNFLPGKKAFKIITRNQLISSLMIGGVLKLISKQCSLFRRGLVSNPRGGKRTSFSKLKLKPELALSPRIDLHRFLKYHISSNQRKSEDMTPRQIVTTLSIPVSNLRTQGEIEMEMDLIFLPVTHYQYNIDCNMISSQLKLRKSSSRRVYSPTKLFMSFCNLTSLLCYRTIAQKEKYGLISCLWKDIKYIVKFILIFIKYSHKMK